MADFALEGPSGLLPSDYSAREACGVVAGCRERIRRRGRPLADAAVEDDRAALVELAGAREQLLERNVCGVVRDPAGVALLGGADVHQLDVAGGLEALRVYLTCHA